MAISTVGQGVAERVERHGVVRLTLDDEAQVAFQLRQIAALFRKHGAGVQQIEVVGEIGKRLLHQLPALFGAVLFGERFDLDQVQLDGVVRLLLACVGQYRGRFLVAIAGIEQLALQQFRWQVFVARADMS